LKGSINDQVKNAVSLDVTILIHLEFIWRQELDFNFMVLDGFTHCIQSWQIQLRQDFNF